MTQPPQHSEPLGWSRGAQPPPPAGQQGGPPSPPPLGQYSLPPRPPQPPKRANSRGLLIGLISGLVLFLGVGSCVAIVLRSGDGAKTQPAQVSAAPSSPERTPEPSSEPSEEDDPNEDDRPPGAPGDTGGIGDQFTYTATRITVSITAARMESHPGGTYLLVKAKIKNGSKTPFDPSTATLSVRYGDDRQPAQRVNISGVTHNTFGGDIAPKKSKTAKFGYQVTKKQAKKLSIYFSPDADRYRFVLITGSAK